MGRSESFSVEVVYAASPARQDQWIIPLKVEKGVTVWEAILQSKILEKTNLEAKIENYKGKVGIFGELVSLNDLVKEGDRIEIYRPLPKDPKLARRERDREFKKKKKESKENK